MPDAKLVYGTYGHLNARKDNAILLPSHYMADHHGYEWLIGPGLALDTTRYFLIATELFGNGHSSSPSNTAEPFSWSPLSGGDHSRQCASGASDAGGRLEADPSQSHHRLLHGGPAGISVGSLLS